MPGSRPIEGGGNVPPIQVVEFRPHESGAMRGFLTVVLSNGMTIRDLVLFEKHGESWTKLPTRRWKTKQNEWREEPIILIEDRDRKQAFDSAVLAGLAIYQGGGR